MSELKLLATDGKIKIEMQKTYEIWYKKWLQWLTKSENIHYMIRFAFWAFAIAYFTIELINVWQPIFNKYIVPYLYINRGWGCALMILCSIATLYRLSSLLIIKHE